MFLQDLTPIARLPDWINPHDGDELPPRISGATIVRFGGGCAKADLEGGGLIIDYIPAGERDTLRVALSFNERGMWVAGLGTL